MSDIEWVSCLALCQMALTRNRKVSSTFSHRVSLLGLAIPATKRSIAAQRGARPRPTRKQRQTSLGCKSMAMWSTEFQKDRRGSSLRILGSLAAPWNLNENSQTSESTDSAVNLDPEEAPTPCFVWSLFVQATHRQPWRLCANCPNPARHSVRYDPL